MIRFGSLKKDYSLSKGDMTLENGLRSLHSKNVQLHNYSDCYDLVQYLSASTM